MTNLDFALIGSLLAQALTTSGLEVGRNDDSLQDHISAIHSSQGCYRKAVSTDSRRGYSRYVKDWASVMYQDYLKHGTVRPHKEVYQDFVTEMMSVTDGEAVPTAA